MSVHVLVPFISLVWYNGRDEKERDEPLNREVYRVLFCVIDVQSALFERSGVEENLSKFGN